VKKIVTALMCALALFGAQSAVAGPGKGVVTHLVPTPPVVEVKPLPEETCRMFSTTETSVVSAPGVSVSAQYIQPGCCCPSAGIYVPGVAVPFQSVPTTLIQTFKICK